MKKVLFSFIVLLLSASFAFSQTYNATLAIDDVDVSTLSAGDDVIIPVRLEYMDPGGLDIGFQFFIEFDHAVLTWKGTNPNPTPGVTNFNPVMPYNTSDWFFNDNGTALVVLWNDPTYAGVYMADGEQFFDLIFTYNGGLNNGDTSPLFFETSKNMINGGKLEKGVTEMYSQLFDYFVLSYTDGSVYVGGTTLTDWTGAIDDDWFNAGNWTNGVPADGVDVTIPDVSKAPFPVISGGTATTGTLTIAANAMLTVGPTGALTTNGLFTNDGFFLITSDMTGSAGSFIDNGGLAGSGTYEFDRYMASAPVASNNGWHLVSSPVSNTVSGDFNSYWLNEWDETTNYFVAVDPWTGATPCQGTSVGNISLSTMKGYAVKRDVDYITQCGGCPAFVPALDQQLGVTDMIAFGGDAYGAYNPNLIGVMPGWNWVNSATDPALMTNVNTGNFNASVTASNFAGNANDNWNLLGNPYSAPLDNATLVGAFPAGVNQSVYIWDDANLTYQSYSGGVGVAQTPATQAFFVNATAAATVSVNNAMRTHNGAGSYYKSDVEDLVILTATGNGLTDRTYIRFLDESNSSFDSKYDAYKLFSTADGVPQIYTTQGDIEFSINTQPAVDLVHMGFKAQTSGTYTIEAIETSDFANVVLEDVVTGIETDLLQDSYTFNYTEGENANRFIVHFTPLGTPELEANSIHIWSSERNIYVSVPETVTGDVAVYNMMGQEVVANKVQPGMNVIPVNDVNTYYVVKVRSNNNVVTEKVFIR